MKQSIATDKASMTVEKTQTALGPFRSAKYPATGLTNIEIRGNSISSIPILSGFMPRPSSKKNGNRKFIPSSVITTKKFAMKEKLKFLFENNERSSSGSGWRFSTLKKYAKTAMKTAIPAHGMIDVGG